MATGITDYTVYPLVPKGGIVQLMYRQGESAFHVALASNTASAEWEAEVLCRPFLRLPFDRAPSAISRPGSLTLTDGKLTMTVRTRWQIAGVRLHRMPNLQYQLFPRFSG